MVFQSLLKFKQNKSLKILHEFILKSNITEFRIRNLKYIVGIGEEIFKLENDFP
jgi:hypothetical protein